MLLLRKDTQAILDSYGLTQLHTSIEDNTLTLVGECGKPLVSISGIKFNSIRIRQAEREYAVELFTKFMTKHSAPIVDYIIQATSFSSLPTLPLPAGTEKSYYDTTIDIPLISTSTRKKIQVSRSLSFTIEGNYTSLSELNNLLITHASTINSALVYQSKMQARDATQKGLDTLRASLASCSI